MNADIDPNDLPLPTNAVPCNDQIEITNPMVKQTLDKLSRYIPPSKSASNFKIAQPYVMIMIMIYDVCSNLSLVLFMLVLGRVE